MEGDVMESGILNFRSKFGFDYDNAKTKIESTESDRKIWIFRKEFEIVAMQEGFELFESRKWITSGKDRWNVNQCRIKNDMLFVTYTKFEGLTYRMMHIDTLLILASLIPL